MGPQPFLPPHSSPPQANLRTPSGGVGEEKPGSAYAIPCGDWFESVSSGHYLAEMVGPTFPPSLTPLATLPFPPFLDNRCRAGTKSRSKSISISKSISTSKFTHPMPTYSNSGSLFRNFVGLCNHSIVSTECGWAAAVVCTSTGSLLGTLGTHPSPHKHVNDGNEEGGCPFVG